MKGKRKTVLALLCAICVLCIAFAFGCAAEKTYYTVTFMDGETLVGTVEVEKGKKVESYPTPSRADADFVFDGWRKDEALETVWNHDIERVNGNITLYANFLYVSATPNNAAMDTGVAFSNTLIWLQRGINQDTEFSVELYRGVKISADGYAYEQACEYREENLKGSAGNIVLEQYKDHADIFTVKWTPKAKPAGGYFAAKITCGEASAEVEGLLFKGAGTQENPYLITGATDLSAVNTTDVSEDGYYRLEQSFKANLSAKDIADKTFDGKLDGNGKTITLESSDTGLFGALGENAVVEDMTVAGSVSNISRDCTGAIANVNRGEISYCTVSANMDSAIGTVGTLEGGRDGIVGGAAGVAGINYGKIICCKYSGQIKSNVGGAGIAVINNGEISLCSLTGTLGAANSTETGNSTKAYSYMGGIVALNYATVEKSYTSGNGKLLAQRADSGANDYIGGIAAINLSGALITECYFDGIRVHGNRNVGGIAGANEGEITFCYSGGRYHGGNAACHSYVGGYENVGGIAGLLRDGGTVKNCYAVSNVYAYSGAAYRIAKAATDSAYLDGTLDLRDGTVSVSAPEGSNVCIEEADLSVYKTSDYKLVLDGAQLEVLNGNGEAFVIKNGGVYLACESESTSKSHIITVKIGENTLTVSSTLGDKIKLKDYAPEVIPEGNYLAGWSLIEGGEVVFDAKAEIGYSALEEYNSPKMSLYSVFKVGEDPAEMQLSVAVYKQYVEEELMASLMQAFEEYCNRNGLSGGEFSYVMIGDDDTKVGDFCKEVTAGDFNIIFGHRANLTIDVIGNADTLLKVNGTARRIAKLSERTLSNAFYDFVLNDPVAKKILDSSYISEAEADKIIVTLMNGTTQYGENLTVSNATDAVKVTLPVLEAEEGFEFRGWALTAQAADGETLLKGGLTYAAVKDLTQSGTLTLYARFEEVNNDKVVLKVAVYKKFIDQPIVDALKAAFDGYCKDNAINNVELQFDLITTGNGAAFTSDAADYDVAIGHKGGTSFVAKETATVAMLLNAANGGTVATDRKAERLTDSEIALKFMEFLKTDEGKAAMTGN